VDTSTSDVLTPVPVSGPLFLTDLSAGSKHTCGVSSDGVGYCWGFNFYGQLGDGTTVDRRWPVPASGSLTFESISAGRFHTCGVELNPRRAFCWGDNPSGQLGDGSTEASLTPVEVREDWYTITAISAGTLSTCAVARDIYYRSFPALCWGDNRWGQLGDGSKRNSSLPVRVLTGMPPGGHQRKQGRGSLVMQSPPRGLRQW